MNTLSNNLQKNLTFIKHLLPSEDILTYRFQTQDKTPCAIVYADGMVNKQLIGELVAKPLSALNLQERRKESNESTSSTDDKKTQKETDVAPPPSNGKKSQKEGGRDENTLQIIKQSALFPELKEQKKWEDVVKEVLDGNVLLFVDGVKNGRDHRRKAFAHARRDRATHRYCRQRSSRGVYWRRENKHGAHSETLKNARFAFWKRTRR